MPPPRGQRQGRSVLDLLSSDWGREEQWRTLDIQLATALFIMKTNSNREWGKDTEQLTLQVAMLPGLQRNLGFLVSQASNPRHGRGLRLEIKDDVDEDKDGIQGLLLGDFFEGLLWDLVLGLERRSRNVRRARSPSSIPRTLASTFLASLKAQKCSSLPHLIPTPHLEHTADLTSSGVVPFVVLKAPAVGEQQVISISTTVQSR